MTIPHALPAIGAERARALASYGDFALQVVQMWALVRDEKAIDPMSGATRAVVNWIAFREMYDAEHPATEGISRADAFEALRLCEREANSDPQRWAEVTGVAEA